VLEFIFGQKQNAKWFSTASHFFVISNIDLFDSRLISTRTHVVFQMCVSWYIIHSGQNI
jgi:hypothetical protein